MEGDTFRVVVINDEAFPFRLPFFRALASSLPQMRVLFLSRPAHRRWDLPQELGFPATFLRCLTLHLTKSTYDERRDIHLPLTLFWRLMMQRPDLVVSYAFSVPTWIATVYSRLARTPLVVWSEGTAHTEARNSRLQNRSRRLVIARAQGFLAGSNEARDRLVELGAPPERVAAIAHAASAAFSNIGRPAAEPARLLYVGALSELKGICHLVPILSLVRRRVPQASLRVVGEGPLEQQLQHQARQAGLAEAVTFNGFVQPREMPEVYSRADAFVFPTMRDTYAHVIAEAATAGLPIISSPFAGAAEEFVIDASNGFVCDPRDHQAFADAVVRVVSTRECREAMADASVRVAAAKGVRAAADRAAELLTATWTRRGDR